MSCLGYGSPVTRACCCSCLRDLCRTDLQSNEEAAQQKNAGRRRGGGICRCNSGSPSDCADTDAALKIFHPSAAWPTTRRSLPTHQDRRIYSCQKTHACQKAAEFSSGSGMTAADVVGGFYPRFISVSFFKEQGECREAACAERQPKCGGKIIACFGVVRRAWGCGRRGSRYGCGSCRRCRHGLRCRRGRRFRRGRCGGLCSRCCRRFHGGGCRRLRGRGQLGRGDGEGDIQPVSVACQRQVLDGCTGRRRVLYGACYGCYFIISRF